MTVLDYFAFVVIALPPAIGIFIFVFLGTLPGKVASERNHPNATAVKMGGWASLVLGVVGYPFFLAWAYMTPEPGADVVSDGGDS